LTPTCDFPPYPGNPSGRAADPIPDFPLTFTDVGIQVLAWARPVLGESLDWVSRVEQPKEEQKSQLRVIRSTVSANDKRDDYLRERYESEECPIMRKIRDEIREHPGWTPLKSDDAARKAYVRMLQASRQDTPDAEK
jgi:hypothetical protein